MGIAKNLKSEKFQDLPLELKGITKHFPGIIANDNVEFTLREGEIHTILGRLHMLDVSLITLLYAPLD